MKKLVLIRLKSLPDRTLGRLSVFCETDEQGRFCTLEPPWRDNEKAASCIPAGRYVVEPRISYKHGDHLILRDVPGRDLILIHTGNYPKNSTGCILLGYFFNDIDGNGELEVSSSRSAMGLLTQLIRDPASLVIVDA